MRVYTLRSTLHTLHFTLYTPHFTLDVPHSTLYTLHSTLYTLHSTVYTLQSTLYTLHFALHTRDSTLSLYTSHLTLDTSHSTIPTPYTHSLLNTPLSLRSPACTPLHSTLRSLHWYPDRRRMHKTVEIVCFKKVFLRDCMFMCFDICTVNIRVSIRVRGLHLV